jgi:hypothetical protein
MGSQVNGAIFEFPAYLQLMHSGIDCSSELPPLARERREGRNANFSKEEEQIWMRALSQTYLSRHAF